LHGNSNKEEKNRCKAYAFIGESGAGVYILASLSLARDIAKYLSCFNRMALNCIKYTTTVGFTVPEIVNEYFRKN